jgi:hypothetical protein
MSNDKVTARPEHVVVGQGVLRESVHLRSGHGVGVLHHGQADFIAVDETQVPHKSLQRCGCWNILRPVEPVFVANEKPTKRSIHQSLCFEERDVFGHIVEQFRTAIALFDLLERTDPPLNVLKNEYHTYRMIAARDGALCIFHFKCCLEAIKKQLSRSKSLSSLVDRVKIRETLKRFTVLFPHADSARHAIAHAGEVFKSPESMKQHGMKVSRYGPGYAVEAGGYLLSSLHGRTYSVGNKGEIFSVTLDDKALANLKSIQSAISEALNLLV